VFNDQKGELIKPIIVGGRQNPGMAPMPAFPQFSDADVEALAEYLHAVQATMRGQGNPPASAAPVVLNLLVGNAAAGQAYFQKTCSSCHSPTGDLAGIGSRIPDVMALQNSWVAGRAGGGGGRGGGGGGGRGGGAGPAGRPTTATVTLANGQKFEGPLVRYDDFIVTITLADGTPRSFKRTGDVPKVAINDPREPHIKLLPTYTDKDIHDVTAYLVTLK
jgi:cytochrome c oxidase cbb3-type subunit 3